MDEVRAGAALPGYVSLLVCKCACSSSGHLRRRQSYLEPLENGRILSQGSSFTYQDVLEKLIVYTLAGAEAWSDEFRFSLTDGLYTEMGRVEFSMELPKNEPPRLAVNRGLQLPAGTV